MSEGHPDKVCDRISDEIVDMIYEVARRTGVDPWSVRVACETLATTNRVVIAGEVRVPDTFLKKNKDGTIAHDAAGHPLIILPVSALQRARRSVKSVMSRTALTGAP